MTEIGAFINNGKYEILTQIGKGGMSTVYLAMDKNLNKQWAVKEIRKVGSQKKDEIIVSSLLAEADLMKKLDHPALPRIVDIIDNGETIYIVMDYIEGTSLDKVLGEFGSQSEELVINWSKQICDALGYLHSQKPSIIYRDMKPANIMLNSDGNIKIIDFGIAREYKEQNLSDTTVLGTQGYAPPEQYSGQTDARSDIYALGMTMHHLLTGVDPRGGEPYVPARQWNPEVSEGMAVIIDKCVEPAAENRYQTCSELIYDLQHPELITSGFKRMQKRRFVVFITTFILAILTLATGVGCSYASEQVNSNTYEALVSLVTSTSYDEKIDSYKQAITLYPYDTTAYLLFLEAYETEGVFSQEQNDEFLALYNANQDGFDKSSTEFAQLNYKIGMMYFNYYSNEDGSYSFSNRVQKAYSFFESNYVNEEISLEFEELSLSNCYYQICKFYKTYILSSSTVEEASKANYEELFEIIELAIIDVEDTGAYDQLTLYNSVFMLLYDQRSYMASVNVELETIIELFDYVHDKAIILSVQKEQSQLLQQEISENYDEYYASIQRTYSNTAERS